jgi:hypothetical protein
MEGQQSMNSACEVPVLSIAISHGKTRRGYGQVSLVTGQYRCHHG